jgi:hypothetical protein
MPCGFGATPAASREEKTRQLAGATVTKLKICEPSAGGLDFYHKPVNTARRRLMIDALY